jgi:hypothetical protein
MSGNNAKRQRALCDRYHRDFLPPTGESKVGIALETIGQLPLNGLRHPPTVDTNGWFIWAGEFSEEPDFFSPLHTSHLEDQLPQVLEYLGLPPGSRFLLANDHVDVWFDESLLNAD